MRLFCPCSMAIASAFKPNPLPRICVSNEYPPQTPCQHSHTLLLANVLRENVASIPLVGAWEKSLPKTRLSLQPPWPVSIVVCPAQRKKPSPPCVTEL